jgi:hypothetical protein
VCKIRLVGVGVPLVNVMFLVLVLGPRAVVEVTEGEYDHETEAETGSWP